MRSSLLLTTIAVATALAPGCNSVSSTLVNRTESDLFYGNSNGKPCRKCQTRPFKGVPITIRVPTHLEIAVKETLFLELSSDEKRLQQVITPHPQLFIETKLVETDKVITVDPKRPAAGSLDYTMNFGKKDPDPSKDNAQYFTDIRSNIVDKTINDVNTALQGIIPLLQAKKTSGKLTSGVNVDKDKFFEEHRVVAWKRFDIDAVDFEQQVADFIDQHLNCNSKPVVLPQPAGPAVK
ncbi:MAG: hypothetical protein HY290_06865 [Planctomycetia bacterium]|nr:hypothetical protein [Planctomycetia bacterium]